MEIGGVTSLASVVLVWHDTCQQWRDDWLSVSVVNCILETEPTTAFKLSLHSWSLSTIFCHTKAAAWLTYAIGNQPAINHDAHRLLMSPYW